MANWLRSLIECSHSLVLLSVLTVLIHSANVQAHCDLEGFNLTSLNSASYWSVSIADIDKGCVIPQGYRVQDVTSCIIYFSVCKRLPAGKCPAYNDSSTCQVVTTNDNDSHYFNIGYYKEDHDFKPIDGEAQGFSTVLQGGNQQATSCGQNNYTTVMKWRCDSDAHWSPSSNNVTQLTSNIAHLDCSLTLEFDYSGACHQPVRPTVSPSLTTIFTSTPTMSGSPTATPPPHTTSAPVIPDGQQSKQLIAGIVVVVVICAILTALLVASGWYIYKLGGLSVARQGHYGGL